MDNSNVNSSISHLMLESVISPATERPLSNRTMNFDVTYWHGFQYELNEEILFKFQMKKHFHFGFTLLGILGNFICIWILKSLLKYKFNWYINK